MNTKTPAAPLTYGILSRCRSELMGAAMLMVMLFHADGLDLGGRLPNLLRGLGFGGVDVFILLSAVGVTRSLTRRPQSWDSFMARRMGRLMPAYFAVMLPYTLFLILREGAPWSALLWNSTLLSYWIHCPGMFNWYITGAMVFYAISPWHLRRLTAARSREWFTAGGAAVCLLLSQLLMQEGYWYYVDIVYRIGTFSLGMLMGLYVEQERPLRLRDALFWGAVLLAGGGYALLVRYGQQAALPVFFPVCHLFLFTTVPLCLLLALCLERLPLAPLRRGLRLLGECSLEIYLLNISLFAQVPLLCPPLPFDVGRRLFYLLAFAANIGLGVLLNRAIARLRRRFARGGQVRPAAD